MKHSERFSPVTRQRWPQRIDPVLDRLASALEARPDTEMVQLLGGIAAGLNYAECRALGKTQPIEQMMVPAVLNRDLAVVLGEPGGPNHPISVERIIVLLRPIWHAEPSYRFGQLIVRLTDSIPGNTLHRNSSLSALRSIEDDLWDPLFTLLDADPALLPGDAGGKWLAEQTPESLEGDYGWTRVGIGSEVRFSM